MLTHLSRNITFLSVVVFITIVSACSFKSIYNRLDYLIPSYVEGMVSLDGSGLSRGNRVTCRDWFQLSLKEGLTVFRDQQFSGDLITAIATHERALAIRSSLAPGSLAEAERYRFSSSFPVR